MFALSRQWRVCRVSLSAPRSLSTATATAAPSQCLRTVRIGNLPEGYDLKAVVQAIPIGPVQKLEAHSDSVVATYPSRFLAHSLLKRGVVVDGKTLDVVANNTEPLSAATIARMGYMSSSRSVVIYSLREMPSDEEIKAALSTIGPHLRYSRISNKAGGTSVYVSFLNESHGARCFGLLSSRALPGLEKCRCKFTAEETNRVAHAYSGAKSDELKDVPRMVILSHLRDDITNKQILQYLNDTLSTYQPGEKVVSIRRTGLKNSQAAIKFVNEKSAQLFTELFQQKAAEWKLKVDIKSISALRPHIQVAVWSGASRIVKIELGQPSSFKTLHSEFSQFGPLDISFIPKEKAKFGAVLAYHSLTDAMKAVHYLTTGRHSLKRYEGCKISFGSPFRQIQQIKPSYVAPPSLAPSV